MRRLLLVYKFQQICILPLRLQRLLSYEPLLVDALLLQTVLLLEYLFLAHGLLPLYGPLFLILAVQIILLDVL